MAVKKSTTATRVHVTLPQAVTSEADVVWPGSAKGGGNRNVELRQQLATEIAGMEMGSVRRYDIEGEKEQKAFASLFRSVVDQVHGPIFGVQTVSQNGSLFVKLGNRITRTRTAKS